MRHSVEVCGPAPVDLAWECYADPALWSTWAPQIRHVSWEGGDRLAPGLAGVVHAIARVKVPFEVTAVDAAAHDWSWTVRVLGMALHLRHTLEAHRDGARAGLVIEGPPPVVLGYAPVARIALRRLLATSD